jgi:hypothetical protein
VGRREDNDVAFRIEVAEVVAARHVIGARQDRDVYLAAVEPVGEIRHRALADGQLHSVVPLAEVGEEPGEPHMADGRQDADAERDFRQEPEVLREVACGLGLLGDLGEMRQHRAPELGEQDTPPLAVEELGAKLALERPDPFRQRGLRDVARLGRLGEIELPRRRQHIADLRHFHRGPSFGLPGRC